MATKEEAALIACNEAFTDPKTEELLKKLTAAVQDVLVAGGDMGDHTRLAAMALLTAEIETMALDGNPLSKVVPGGLEAYRAVFDLALNVARAAQDVMRATASTELAS